MKVPIHQPRIKVLLHKTVMRARIGPGAPVSARFKGSAPTIDLTPFLGETGSVHTSKSHRDPAGGFSVTLTDKPHTNGLGLDSLYGLIEPMDFLEIRMISGPGKTPPVVMRAFVSDVSRSEAVDANGRPIRTVSIVGQDYGKLWQQMQIIYRKGYVIGEQLLTNFKLLERSGAGLETSLPAAEFVRQVMQLLVNPYLKNLMPANTSNPSEIQMDLSVKHGTTSLTGPQNQEGTIFQLLQTYGDVGIWNELYLEDRDEGVFCVYRPNPFETIEGKRIQDDAPTPVEHNIDHAEVLSMNVSRGDNDVANFYWCAAPRFDLVSEYWRQQYALSDDRATINLSEYENAAAKLYGIRLMEVATQQGGDDVKTANSGQTQSQTEQRDTGMFNWINDRRRILAEQNKDNVVLERGLIRMRGNPAIRSGHYINIVRGSFRSRYYVTRVDHEFTPFQNYVTTLSLERGTGFIERARRDGGADSPYLSEIRGLR